MNQWCHLNTYLNKCKRKTSFKHYVSLCEADVHKHTAVVRTLFTVDTNLAIYYVYLFSVY